MKRMKVMKAEVGGPERGHPARNRENLTTEIAEPTEDGRRSASGSVSESGSKVCFGAPPRTGSNRWAALSEHGMG